MSAGDKLADILGMISNSADSVVKSAEEMTTDWKQYEKIWKKAKRSLSKFKDLANTMKSSQEKYNSKSLHSAIQPAVPVGNNQTNLLRSSAIPNLTIFPRSKLNCGPPDHRNMDCCLDVLCGGVLAESMLNNLTRDKITTGLKCLGHGNFTSCFRDIPAAGPMMTCMACSYCIEAPANLNCSESEITDFSQFLLP